MVMAYLPRYSGAGVTVVAPEVLPYWHGEVAASGVARRAAMARRHERRRSQTTGTRYRFEDVAERDNWTCHLCELPIDPTLSRRDPMGATIDHLVPVALGGGDEESNVALAHSTCNIHRGTRLIA